MARENVEGLESNPLNMEGNNLELQISLPQFLMAEWVKINDILCNPCIEGETQFYL